MPAFHLQFMGRTGNCACQYLFAKGYCERNGYELFTDEWLGEKIWNIAPNRWTGRALPVRNEFEIQDGKEDIAYRSYSQQQKCADYYAVRQAREWLKFRNDSALRQGFKESGYSHAIGHLRRGDYKDLGYVMPTLDSYLDAAKSFGVGTNSFVFIGDDKFETDLGHPDLDLEHDLFAMSNTAHLFRANSTLSFVAGLLNPNRVFAPIVDGLSGGEHDCQWVEGNWPRFANFHFTTDMHVSP